MESILQESLSSVKSPDLQSIKKSDLKEYFLNTWHIYEELFSGIIYEKTYYESPDPLRNPLIFYWGHTAVFYINKFILAGIIKERINPHFEDIFAKGVDPDLPENLDVLDLWPSLEEVNDYRRQVYQLVIEIIDALEDDTSIDENHALWSLLMSIEHDRIHFETSSVLIRQLSVDFLEKPSSWKYAPSQGDISKNEMIKIKGGKVIYGKSVKDGVFGWDNEYGTKESLINDFSVSKNLITNNDYLEFVLSGSYNNQKFWTKEGFEWKQRVNSKHPKFWVPSGESFNYRAQFDTIKMPLSWPIELNAHEAIAYCNWKGNGYRLLTENEYQYLLSNYSNKETHPFVNKEKYNIDLHFHSPSPVGYFENANESPLNDLQGNVWEWLGSLFDPLKGFKTHYLYEDFSAPYFDDDHNMMLGGSWATTGFGATFFYRLWFRRHFYQHAGFRLAKTIDEKSA